MVSIDQEKNGASVIFVLECYECKNQLVKTPHKTYITARPICLSKKKTKKKQFASLCLILLTLFL